MQTASGCVQNAIESADNSDVDETVNGRQKVKCEAGIHEFTVVLAGELQLSTSRAFARTRRGRRGCERCPCRSAAPSLANN